MAIDIKGLQGIIDKYEYGNEEIFKPSFRILHNPNTNKFLLENCYPKSPSNVGECFGLNYRAFLDIRKKHPEYNLIRVVGKEPQYFGVEGSAHNYLLVCESDPMQGQEIIEDNKTIELILKENPLIVDSSFKRIGKVNDLQYSADRLINQKVNLGWTRSYLIEKNSEGYFPLTLTNSKNIVSMEIIPVEEDPIFIGIEFEKGHIFEGNIRLGRNWPEIEEMLRAFPELKKYVECLRKIKIISTNKNLTEDEIIYTR